MPNNILYKPVITGIILFFCVFLLPLKSTAQIIAIEPSAAFPNSFNPSDSIFVFNANNDDFNTRTGSLKAFSPDSTPGYTFTWFKYNNFKWDTLSGQNTDSVSEKTGLTSGGYMVKLTNGIIDTFYYAHVYINRYKLYVRKNKEGKTPIGTYGCDYLILSSIQPDDIDSIEKRYFHDDYIYYYNLSDTANKTARQYSNINTFKWTASTEVTFDISNRSKIRLTQPPPRDTWFKLTATDILGNSEKDSVQYISIVPKADFTMAVKDSFDSDFIEAEADSVTGEAPLSVKFHNTSVNAIAYTWFLTDTVIKGSDSVRVKDFPVDSIVEYRVPRRYNVRLVATSDDGCIDSSAYKKVVVDNSAFGRMPNAFSPSYAGILDASSPNDFFTVKYDDLKSIKRFRLIIFNRWGRELYNKDLVKENWQGWDGTVHKKKATPGIYYYVVEVEGYGNITLKGGSPSSTTPDTPTPGTKAASTGGQSTNSRFYKTAGYFYLYRSRD
jgi:gliding motility-associated-like protein